MTWKKLLCCLRASTLVFSLFGCCAIAQSFAGANQADSSPSDPDNSVMIFNHSRISPFWISGQVNLILQWHPRFPARYSGENSLRPEREKALSRLLTLYTGVQLGKNTELLLDVESSSGRGISDAVGLAGFTNLDVVRSPALQAKPYLARLMLRHVVALSSGKAESERGALSLATTLPERRLEFRLGKLSTVDFFDANAPGSDSRLQFLNWTVDNNGAFDYAADTRGYTWGAMIEYQQRRWGLRFGEMLMPTIANGIKLDWNVRRARAENYEFEFREKLIPDRSGTMRLLAFVNHANMGSYREAIQAFRDGKDPLPDIEAHRRQGRIKYGFGFNFEQELTDLVRVFGRFGWNEGRHESFAYTEVDQSVQLGADLKGNLWKRKQDKVGAAMVVNAISGDHRQYLALGGRGFLLGDGALKYGREKIFECYYNLHVWRGVSFSFDLQRIINPGYNRDRGPVLIPGVRLHLEL